MVTVPPGAKLLPKGRGGVLHIQAWVALVCCVHTIAEELGR